MPSNKKILFFLFIFYLLCSCANVKPLGGGEKDTKPPEFLRASPENKSTGISTSIKKIEIEFNENIVLADPQKIIVSPPPKNPFDFFPRKISKKILTILPKGDLEENTTYVINFGESIRDNTEGNILSFFKYIFSTGVEIDSLKISGKIKDAFEQEIPQNVVLALYKVEGERFEEDRLFKEPPYYSSKASKEGKYQFDNLSRGKYQLVAFSDPISTFMYDPKKEKFGFIEELIFLEKEERFDLSLSKEILPFKALQPKKKAIGMLEFPFEGDIQGLEIRCTRNLERQLSIPFLKENFIEFWYKLPKDENEKDEKSFRLEFELVKEGKSLEKVGIDLKSDSKEDKLDFSLKRKNTSLAPTKPIEFYLNRPLFKVEKEKIKIQNKEGEIIPFEFVKNLFDPKIITLSFAKTFEESFKIIFEEAALEDILGVKNPKLSFDLVIGKESDFGNLHIELNKIPIKPFFLQVLNNKKEVVNEFYSKEANYSLKHLDPGEYQLRLIIDENEDKRWNPCNFKERKQAEPVYYSKPFVVKALWEVNESWDYTIPLPDRVLEEEKDNLKKEDSLE